MPGGGERKSALSAGSSPEGTACLPFNECMRLFLHQHATRVPISGVDGCSAYVVRLASLPDSGKGQDTAGEERQTLLLHVYEERLTGSKGSNTICDQCRNMGEHTYIQLVHI